METKQLKNHLHISGDVKTFSDIDHKETIPALLAEHQILTFDVQDLTMKEFSDLNLMWGEHIPTNIWACEKEFPIIFRVTNREVTPGKQGLFAKGDLDWHNNGPFSKDPETCVSLYCEQPCEGSITTWTNGRNAYLDLPDDIKEKIDDLDMTLTNVPQLTYLKRPTYNPDLPEEQLIQLGEIGSRSRDGMGDPRRIKRTTKKLVHIHPITGKKVLYLPILNVAKLHCEDGESLFHYLVDHYITTDRYSVHHRWEKGSMLMADQVSGIHRRNDITGDRDLWRTQFWYR